MRVKAKRQQAKDELMNGLRRAISMLPGETSLDVEIRQEAIEQFRRVEKLFGYEAGSWEPFI